MKNVTVTEKNLHVPFAVLKQGCTLIVLAFTVEPICKTLSACILYLAEELMSFCGFLYLGCSETEEQLQFPLELCTDTSSANTQTSSKIPGSLSLFLKMHPGFLLYPASLTGITHLLH